MAKGIVVAKATTLLSPEYKHALAARLVEDEMTREGSFLFLMPAILDFHDDGGLLIDQELKTIVVDENIVERAYGFELTYSWTTDIKKFATAMPKRRSPARLLLRFQVWDAAYRIIDRPITI